MWWQRLSEAGRRVRGTGGWWWWGCYCWKQLWRLRQTSAHNSIITEIVYAVLNSLWYCEPVEKSKQRSDLVRFLFLFLLLFVFVCFSERGEQHRSDWTKAMDRGSRQTGKERIAVVEAWQNEWGRQFHCSLGGKILPGGTNWTELIVGEFGGLINEVSHGQCGEKNAYAFDSQTEWLCDCGQAERCCQQWRVVFVLFRAASLLSFHHFVEDLFVSFSFWCPNKSQMWFSEECIIYISDHEEENSPTAHAGTRTSDLSITSPALQPPVIPAPEWLRYCLGLQRPKHAPEFTIQYNTTLLSLCREICFLARHLHKNIQYS